MIHRIITKYGLAAHLALLASLSLALTPFVSGGTLGVTILWLSALALVWLLSEPSIRAGEHLSLARTRVRSEILRDPLFWFLLFAVLFAGVRWLNSGITMSYSTETAQWSVSTPRLKFLPASVGEAGFLPFASVVGVSVLAMGILHGIGLAARISFGLVFSFVLGLGGAAATACACFELEPFAAKSAAGLIDGPFYGMFFGVGLVVAVVSGALAEMKDWSAARLPYCLAVAGNGCGLLFFSPPLLVVFSLCPIVFFVLFCVANLSRRGSASAIARFLVLTIFGLSIPAVVMLSLAPEGVVAAKTNGIDIHKTFPEIWSQTSVALARISRGIWSGAPWCGAGIGAYKLQLAFQATSDDWTILAPSTAAAMNGYWTILAERGIIGCLLLALGVVLLMLEWILRLVGAVRYLDEQDDADTFLFACPPAVWLAPLVLLSLGAEVVFSSTISFGAFPFAVVTPLALSAASFPRRSNSSDSSSPQEN